MASLYHFIKKSHKNILLMKKRSRLEVKKTLVQISNRENKMAAIIWQPSCFDHLKSGQKVRFSDGRNKMAASLDRFINKSNKKIFYSCQYGLG
jgi:hypothetical protein